MDVLRETATGSGPQVYELYGLRVWSEVALPAPLAWSALPPYDIQVRWGESKAISDCTPAGQTLANFAFGDGRGYALMDTGAGYILHYYRACQFWIGYDLRSVSVHLSPDAEPDVAALLLTCNVIACVLLLSGEYVLHASAVEIGGQTIAFMGGSGMGKSTLATLLCTRGARFVTDDLLRLQLKGKDFRCFPGVGEIRLRKGASALAEDFPTMVRRTTPDDRIALKVDNDRSMPRLSAFVVPRPSRRCHRLKLERLPCSRALLYLMAYSRVQGLQQGEYLQRQLNSFACIASNVPVFAAEIPWGPPFPPEIAVSLVRGVGLELPEEALL